MSDVEGDQRKPMWLKQTWDLVSQLSLIGAMQWYPNRIAGAHGSFYGFLLWNSLSACALLPVMASYLQSNFSAACLLNLDLPQWPLTQVSQQKSCKASWTSFLGHKAAEPARNKIARSLCAVSEIWNKTKHFFKCLTYTWECKQQISITVVWSGRKSCHINMTALLSF